MLWHYSYPPSGDHGQPPPISMLDINYIVIHQTQEKRSNLSLECGSNINICHEHTLFLLIALVWQIKLHVALWRTWEQDGLGIRVPELGLSRRWGAEFPACLASSSSEVPGTSSGYLKDVLNLSSVFLNECPSFSLLPLTWWCFPFSESSRQHTDKFKWLQGSHKRQLLLASDFLWDEKTHLLTCIWWGWSSHRKSSQQRSTTSPWYPVAFHWVVVTLPCFFIEHWLCAGYILYPDSGRSQDRINCSDPQRPIDSLQSPQSLATLPCWT